MKDPTLPIYESRKQKPISRPLFLRRMLMHVSAALALLLFSVGMGMAGYAGFEHLGELDAFLNSAMLLGGMGPVNMPVTDAGKSFAGLYALYAGLVFLVSAALVFTPVVPRILHRFHWDEE
ncbi:MAG: hypothetical protein ABIT61_03160 [Steroidobacteraceae bacterium]